LTQKKTKKKKKTQKTLFLFDVWLKVKAEHYGSSCTGLNDDKDVKYGQKKLESCTEKKTFQVCHAVKRFFNTFLK